MNTRRLLCGLTAAFLTLPSARAGLVAYWPFNSAPALGTDAAGGSVLTATGATFTATGKFGGGLALSGGGQFLSGTVNNLPVGNSTYTQSAWIRPLSPRSDPANDATREKQIPFRSDAAITSQ